MNPNKRSELKSALEEIRKSLTAASTEKQTAARLPDGNREYHMDDESSNKPKDESTTPDLEREVMTDAKLNAVVRSHFRRREKDWLAEMDKRIEARLASQPAPKRASASDVGEAAVWREKFQQLEQQQRETEKKLAREKTNQQVSAALEAKGIRGFRREALISHWRETGRLDDATGRLTVTRSRVKGEPQETLDFDLLDGIDDWAKTAEAGEFLPAPTAKPSKPMPQSMPRPRPLVQQTKSDRDEVVLSDRELAARTAAQLERQGLSVQAAMDSGDGGDFAAEAAALQQIRRNK